METVGLYSFPKSGNTWLRAVLACAMGPGPEGQDLLDRVPDLHRQPLSEAVEFRGHRFFKHHGGRNLAQWKGTRLGTTRVIHIRRHPLDVFLSYLNYISDNVTGSAPIRFASADAIRGTNLFEMYFHSFTVMGHVAPAMVGLGGGWFSHNAWWLEQSDVPVQHLRYEDLLADPEGTLDFLRDWLGLTPADLRDALVRANRLTARDGKFYWRQKAGGYADWLSPAQLERFLDHRAADCARLGYPPETFACAPEVPAS